MNPAGLMATLVALGGAGYAMYSLYTETGPAGWLIYAQQAMFGAASMKLTFLALLVPVGMLTLLVLAIVPQRDAAASNRKLSKVLWGNPAEPTPLETLALWTLALIPVVWLIGFGTYTWAVHSDRSDAEATYEPVQVTRASAEPEPKSRYVALTGGRLLPDAIPEHREGSSSSKPKYHLVPLVASDWSRDQPVRYLIKVDRLESMGFRPAGAVPLMAGARNDPSAQAAAFGWFGRLEGTPPVPAIQALKGMGVVLSDNAQLVRWIPSLDGKPNVPDPTENYRPFFLGICGFASVALLLLAFGWWARGALHARAPTGAGDA